VTNILKQSKIPKEACSMRQRKYTSVSKILIGSHRWLSGSHFKTKILVIPGFPKEVLNHYHPI